jgi:catechol 2,3-dioxygenase-like lactoylglutathione lyase family enzyme
MIVHTILYVKDQQKSSRFYSEILKIEPHLDVPGMTEFQLSEKHILGIMPERGIKKLIGEGLPDPELANGIPRAELYFRVDGAEEFMARALGLGAKLLSPCQLRDWGQSAGYILDLDGHVLAFATEIK